MSLAACASSLCLTCWSEPSSPALELLKRFSWTCPTMTQSSGAVWEVRECFSLQATQCDTWLEASDIEINHLLQLAVQGWLWIRNEIDLQVYLSHALCPQGEHTSVAARSPAWLLVQLIIKQWNGKVIPCMCGEICRHQVAYSECHAHS